MACSDFQSMDVEDLQGTTIVAFVLNDAIIVGYDSRGTNKNKDIIMDDADKLKEAKAVWVALAGMASVAKLMFQKIQTWAKIENTGKVKVSDASDICEKFVMDQPNWPKEHRFATLILGMEDGRPLVFRQLNYDPEHLELTKTTDEFKKKMIEYNIVLGSGATHVEDEMKNYNTGMSKDDVMHFAAFIMLKASLFDARTGGSIYVDCISNSGRQSKNWVVPQLYMERFQECTEWDKNTVFMVFLKDLKTTKNDLFLEWMFNGFNFIEEDDIQQFHIIGGICSHLRRGTILRRVVFRKEETVSDLFKSFKYDDKLKHHIVRDGWTVFLRYPSVDVLRRLMIPEKQAK